MNVCFLIDKLNRGGAERQLIELVTGINKKKFNVTVIIFHDGGELLPDLVTIPDIKIFSFGRKGGIGLFPFIVRIYKFLRKNRPDLLHSYMGGTNELALLLGKLIGIKVVWGIRASNMNLINYSWFARVSFKIGAILSHFTDMIIVNSNAGKQYHEDHGYASRKMTVVYNGIDTDYYCIKAKNEVARVLKNKIGPDGINANLIGIVARLDPMKGYPVFLHAAALLLSERKDIYFICVGNSNVEFMNEMQSLAVKLGLADRIVWTGSIDDMRHIYNSLDIVTLPSIYGEGFPNVIGEAMACGCFCVVTDVGDSAYIVGDAGDVISPGNVTGLCKAWKRYLQLSSDERDQFKSAARKRILYNFTVRELAMNTERKLLKIM